MPEPHFLSADAILARTNPVRMIGAMEQALRAMASGALVVPPREHLEFGHSTLLVMPSAGEELFATKLVTVAAGNAERGLPVIQGLVALFSAVNGSPLATLDAAVLTGQRTGAVAAVGVKYLAPIDMDALGIVGCGVQGSWAAIHSAVVRPIRKLFCLERSRANLDRFSKTVARFAPQVQIISCESAEQLLDHVQCVVMATTSTTPVLPEDPGLLKNKTLISVGSYRPHMQELPNAAFALARAIVIDSPQAITEVGDVINPVHEGLVSSGAVIELGDIVAGNIKAPGARTRILKSVGHAAFDLYAARAVVQYSGATD